MSTAGRLGTHLGTTPNENRRSLQRFHRSSASWCRSGTVPPPACISVFSPLRRYCLAVKVVSCWKGASRCVSVAAHDLCGDGIALCGEAQRSTTNTYQCFSVWWSGSICLCKLCFGIWFDWWDLQDWKSTLFTFHKLSLFTSRGDGV